MFPSRSQDILYDFYRSKVRPSIFYFVCTSTTCVVSLKPIKRVDGFRPSSRLHNDDLDPKKKLPSRMPVNRGRVS